MSSAENSRKSSQLNSVLLSGILKSHPTFSQTSKGDECATALLMIPGKLTIRLNAYDTCASYLTNLVEGDRVAVSGQLMARVTRARNDLIEVRALIVERLN